jgi:hypothetical protein
MSSADAGAGLAARLSTAVSRLLDLDNAAVTALAGGQPPTPNGHALEQSDRLAALTDLLPAVRAAAQAGGYPALEAEQRCGALRAACVEEQHRTVDYLAAAWAMPPGSPPEREDCARRWTRSLLGVEQARDRVMSMLAIPTPATVPPVKASPAPAEQLAPQAPPALQVDTREVPLEAPAGTPSPLREAFDAVAKTLSEAAEMRRCPPNGWALFEGQARALQAAWRAARDRYAAAEILLRAVTDEGGRCAHQEALNAVCRVNDACGHVILAARRARGTISPHQAVAHVLAVPAFDLPELLRAMRRQTSLAALRPGSSTAPPPVTPEATPAGDRQEELAAPRSLKEPTAEAFKAYRALVVTGKTQKQLAQLLTEELKRPIHQGTVSRWVNQVSDWLEAGNVLPDLSEPLRKRPTVMDPERIDLGERQDGRSKRQRGRRNSDNDD